MTSEAKADTWDLAARIITDKLETGPWWMTQDYALHLQGTIIPHLRRQAARIRARAKTTWAAKRKRGS